MTNRAQFSGQAKRGQVVSGKSTSSTIDGSWAVNFEDNSAGILKGLSKEAELIEGGSPRRGTGNCKR